MLRSRSPDPLTLAIAPPANETAQQRIAREAEEERKRQISASIDAEIKAEKAALKKRGKQIKVLVLGQSNSGKSTTIKNFQLTYGHRGWVEERGSWRAIILLNLISSVNKIFDILLGEEPPLLPGFSDGMPLYSRSSIQLPGDAMALKSRLDPLRDVQRTLESLLLSSALDSPPPEPADAAPATSKSTPQRRQFSVVSNTGWKRVLNNFKPQNTRSKQASIDKLQSIMSTAIPFRDDIKALWSDKEVQSALRNHSTMLEDSAGYFLNNVGRILSATYEPQDDDIIRSRLVTNGVQEHHFIIDSKIELVLYDVAGSRTSRHTWVPYFEEVNAILFLAPLSCYDQTLEEDHRVNRLEDSLYLWKYICANKILAKVQLILLLNKCDILQRKLEAGTSRVRDYFAEFGDRANEFVAVTKYFRDVFKLIVNKYTPERVLYSHFTSVVDTQATAVTVIAVQDAIVRNNMTNAGLM